MYYITAHMLISYGLTHKKYIEFTYSDEQEAQTHFDRIKKVDEGSIFKRRVFQVTLSDSKRDPMEIVQIDTTPSFLNNGKATFLDESVDLETRLTEKEIREARRSGWVTEQ